MEDIEEIPLSLQREPPEEIRGASNRGLICAETEESVARNAESPTPKLSVLIGSGILQLPIWGMFCSLLIRLCIAHKLTTVQDLQ